VPVPGGWRCARRGGGAGELHRLTADLAQHSAQGRASLDRREAIAAVVAADGLVVATPVLAACPSEVFDSFFDVLGDGVLSGMPVLLALNNGSCWQPADLAQVIRRRLTDVHTDPVPTVVVAGPPTGGPRLAATRRGCTPASTKRRRTRRGDEWGARVLRTGI
jgi:FMN reductase